MPNRIFTFQPLAYSVGDERFRVTNLGAIVQGLRALGHDAKQVAFAPKAELTGQVVDDILLCSPGQAASVAWWRQLQPWGVITNTWAAPRFEPIRSAILGATRRHVDRLDTDGNRSVHIDWPLYLHAMWSRCRDCQENWWYRTFSAAVPVASLALHWTFPSILEQRQAATLARIPAVTAESPVALARMQRMQRHYGHSESNLHLSPFPVDTSRLPEALSTDSKRNTIVSIGRWDSHQKNFPLLLKTLELFLLGAPNWDAFVGGRLPSNWEVLLRRLSPLTNNRIRLSGPLPHAVVCAELNKAKIYLSTSRHEGLSIAVCEALCLGCAVVGPAHIAGLLWCCGSDSGTLAGLYTRRSLVDALSAEASAWNRVSSATAGCSDLTPRDSSLIASAWRSRASATAVASDMMRLLNSL